MALLGREPFLLANADVYCEFDYSRLLGRPLRDLLAHLVLVPNPPHRSSGDFSVDAGRARNGGTQRYTYAGIALMSPQLVAHVTPGQKAALGPLLHAAADQGALGAELYRGTWQDVGTRERLAALETELASRQ
jgi:MurNAc alpha-1-phosphate uridylyltransferase